MNRYAPRIFATALIALLAAAGGLGYWKSLHDQLPEGLSMGNGRLEATEVQIASKVPGRLAEVLVDEGDKVTRGQLLARIDTRTMQAQRSQAEAEVLRARENYAAAQASVQLRQSELLLASQELKRVREIFQRKYASQQLLDQQQARFDTANAAVVAARAQLAAIKLPSVPPRHRWRSSPAKSTTAACVRPSTALSSCAWPSPVKCWVPAAAC